MLVHNYLRPPSGENTVFEQEKAMLRANGHQVMTYQRQNGGIAKAGVAQKLLLLPNSIWSLKSYRELSKMIKRFKPDVAHFHNTNPLISPSGYYACRRHAVPVVQTLHHYRLVCLGAMLFREGKVCEDCAGLKYLPGIVHGCYRNSRLYSMGLALGLKLHYLLKTWQKTVATYIVFSEFGAAKFIELGLSQDTFSIKPNFVVPGAQAEVSDEGYGLFMGRLDHEKGILYFLEALEKCPEIPFVIGGDGPLRQQTRDLIRQYGLKNIRYLGLLDYRDCLKHIHKASFIVFPSVWYEGMPMVILEAMAAAKPVIAADIGVLPEMIQDGHNGIVFKAGSASELAAKLKWLHSHPETVVRMGQASRKLFEKKYTAQTNYQLLLNIYKNAISKITRRAMRNRKLQISIIGTRGIPGNYGGFETFAERLSCGLVARGHRVSVYCPAVYNNHHQSDYKGVNRIVIPNIKSKSFDKISASIISSVHATISSRQIILFLGVSAVIFAWLPRLFGSKTVINIDGLEWRRKKWNKMASSYLKFSEALSGSICNRVVTDSVEIKKYFKRQYGKESTYISYGADIRSYTDDAVLEKYGLNKEKYILQVCRLEPENNSDLIIKEYCKVDTDVPLIILGDAPYSEEYKRQLKRLADPRVKFLGSVYGHDYEVIRSNPLCYVHGHEVGGTNPALLEAMAAGNCVAVLNVPYNLEVIADAGVSFDRSEGSLKKRLVEILENPNLVSTLRYRASQRIKDNYTWEKIVNAYEDLFFRLAEE